MIIFDDRLDFHEFGLITPEQVAFYLDQFLENAYAVKHIKVLVITGSGKNSPGGQGTVKKTVAWQLKHHKLIKSFKPASSSDGGLGAFEVYIKDC